MNLPEAKQVEEELHELVDKLVDDITEQAETLYRKKGAILQEYTGASEYWGAQAASVLQYRRQVARKRAVAHRVYREGLHNILKNGPRGRLAASSAWGEREAAANAEMVVEYTIYDILLNLEKDLDQAYKIIRTHVDNVKFNKQADLRNEVRDLKYASSKDYWGESQ